MHSSLVVTEEGLPLGLAAVKFWNRDKFKGTAQLKRRINPTRIPIEAKESVRWLDNLRQSVSLLGQPDRCVHVGDRESDIYELYCLARDLGTHFVVRTVVDRLAGSGDHTVKSEMREAPSAGTHIIEVRVDDDTVERVTLDIQYKRIHVCPPIGKQKRYPSLDLTVIHASEVGVPSGRKPIIWKLITDLEVSNLAEAIEKIRWYSMRWKIEVFHKILKSGCRAEDAKLRTADRLANLLALLCIVSWRVMWMTIMARAVPEAVRRSHSQRRKLQSSTASFPIAETAEQSLARSSSISPSWPASAAISRGRLTHRLGTPSSGAAYGASSIFRSAPSSRLMGNRKPHRRGTRQLTRRHLEPSNIA